MTGDEKDTTKEKTEASDGQKREGEREKRIVSAIKHRLGKIVKQNVS